MVAALNQAVVIPAHNEKPVIDLGELVNFIKLDLNLAGVNLEGLESLNLNDLQRMDGNELKAVLLRR
jgi:hypothetical protein